MVLAQAYSCVADDCREVQVLHAAPNLMVPLNPT
jgi:hypothetical protein